MTTVILHRLRLRLYTSESQAGALQNRSSHWFRTRLVHELTSLLTDYANMEGAPRCIDRVIVNVGDIPQSRFEAECSERAIKQLKHQLLMLLTSPHFRVENTTQMADLPQGTTRKPALLTCFAHLLRYLDTGQGEAECLLPSMQARDRWLREALESALPLVSNGSHAPLLPRVALALRLLSPQARLRLVKIGSPAVLSFLVAWLLETVGLPTVTQARVVWMLPLAALIVLHRHVVDEDHVRALPVVSPVSEGQRARLLGVLHTQSTSLFDGEERASAARNGADLPEYRPTDRDPEVLGKWLGALLQSPPLSPPLRSLLLGWLCDSVADRRQVTDLGRLPAPVRHQLRWMLGEPQVQVPPQHEGPAGSPQVAIVPAIAPSRDMPHTRLTFTGKRRREAALSGGREQAPPPRKSSGDERDNVWSMTNAGLVLLWPLLPRLFSTLGWLDEGCFVDEQARWQAVGCLDWLAWGDAESADWRSPCTRLLCDAAWETPFVAFPPSALHQTELDQWLGQALAAVPILARCTPADVRIFFLQRMGTFNEESRTLTIETEASDVLLRYLPWPLTQVVLPWLPSPIQVDWNS
ncbi:contractile injection system tape measure protein [Serratia bockelmannii]|uniref:contractile injection system tape measure protein n=1 Tax=Serratia bockelmannii TaxID=2703793 RepID=UPI003FA7745C